MLDADVVIRGEKGTFDFERWVASRPNRQFEIAAITVAELWHGVNGMESAGSFVRILTAVLDSVPIIPYTEHTANEHARIWAGLEAPGKMIGYYDLMVGATALERGSELATFNKRPFFTDKRSQHHRTQVGHIGIGTVVLR